MNESLLEAAAGVIREKASARRRVAGWAVGTLVGFLAVGAPCSVLAADGAPSAPSLRLTLPQEAFAVGYAAPRYVPGKPTPPGMLPPPEYPYEEGTMLPEGYHLEERPRRGLLTAGYLVTGIPYGAGLLVAAGTRFANGSHYLVVPVVGPWLALGFDERDGCDLLAGSSENEPSGGCGLEIAGDALLLSDGIVQAVGGMLLVMGFSFTKSHAVRDDLAVTVLPLPVQGGVGLMAAGSL